MRRLRTALTDDPAAGGCTGLVLPYELRTDAQVRFEERGGFRRAPTACGTRRRAPSATLAVPVRRRPLRRRLHMAFRRALLLELGGFDDALDTGRSLPGGGDIDMFFRAVMAGHPMLYELTRSSATSTAPTTQPCDASTGRGAPGSWRSSPSRPLSTRMTVRWWRAWCVGGSATRPSWRSTASWATAA